MQLKRWDNFDLSYNRLSGTLSTNFASNESIGLENNRLSGEIPEVFHTLVNTSILESNSFSCRVDQSDLPQHDSGKKQYHCGSNSFDVLFYVWISIIVFAAGVWAHYEYNFGFYRHLCTANINLLGTNLFRTLTAVSQLSNRSTMYTMVVLLPLYAACSVWYGTQTYEYAYVVSAVFMSGVVPFALNWCFWFVLLLGVIITVFPSVQQATTGALTEDGILQASFWRKSIFIFVPYLIIDFIVAVGVNAAYVYVAVYQSSSLLLGVQTLVSIFKVMWGRWALPYILSMLTRRKKYGKVQIVTQIVVNMLNNIAIPCLVVGVVSPNCFYNALVDAPNVATTIEYRNCIFSGALVNTCTQYSIFPLQNSYSPPFEYNYQCSTSLITYYAPAFVSMCIVSTFVTPLAQILCQRIHRRATPGTFWHRILTYSLPRIMKPVSENVWTDKGDSRSLHIGGGELVTTLISTLGLLLTFGVMLPPFCVALAVSIFAAILFFWTNMDNFINSVAEQRQKALGVMIVAECNRVDSMQIFKDSAWILITVSCWFYTFFLFDTLGDAVGFDRAYWVLIVMPVMPLVLYMMYTLFRKLHAYRQEFNGSVETNGSVEQSVHVEMRPLGNEEAFDVHNIIYASTIKVSGNKPCV